MLVFSTLVEVVSERHLVKSSYPSKYSNNSSGKILSWIVCLPAGCPGSVCMFGIFLSTRKVLSGKLVTVSMLVGRSIFNKNMNIEYLLSSTIKYGKQAKLSRATLEFQVKVCPKYGCAKVRLEKRYN